MLTPRSYDALYLSPHLDDVAFSCGGQVHGAARAGERILIVTLFCADPPMDGLSDMARDLHRRWGLGPDAMVVRRQEDQAACETLGADLRHEPQLDAVYRRGVGGEPLYGTLKTLLGRPSAEDRKQLEELRRIMEQLPAAGRIYTPLAAGGHVDHRLARRAAEATFGRRLEYYEDYPYARNRWVLAKALGLRLWKSRVVPLEPENLAARIDAIACFASQLGTAFENQQDMSRQISQFCQRVGTGTAGGERLWRRRSMKSSGKVTLTR